MYARRDFEQAQRALNRQKKFEAWQAELAKDSCSDSDGDAGGELGAEWVERRNLDGGLVWVHNETGEIVTVDPRTDPVDAELIGCSVRVFWPFEEQWVRRCTGAVPSKKKEIQGRVHRWGPRVDRRG